MPTVLHVCLAGEHVTNHLELVRALRQRHQITLVDRLEHLMATGVLTTADVLVLDSAGDTARLPDLLSQVKKGFPRLRVILVNGGLSQREVADAFGIGIADYFPQPCNIGLLGARIEVLGHRLRGLPVSAPSTDRP